MNSSNKNQTCYFAETNFRNKREQFGILLQDRLHHFYIIGRTGTGKTNLLKVKIAQDIHAGRGLCLMDVHGDLVAEVLKDIPKNRIKDVVYLDARSEKSK